MNKIMNSLLILTITSVFGANDTPDQDRYRYFNLFGNQFLAEGTANISLLVSQDLKGEFDDVIVTVVAREDKIISHFKKAFKFFRGEGELIVNNITLSDYISCNITAQDQQYKCTGVLTAINETADLENQVKEHFRIITAGQEHANQNSLYCIGFNLANGMVQIFDYDSLCMRLCPKSFKEEGATLKTFYKPYFSKLVLNHHAIRLVRKAFDDHLSNQRRTIFGITRESHGYAMELLEAANINFPQKIGGWIPAHDYLFITPMESFIRKINYAENQLGLRYYNGSSSRKKLEDQLVIGVS